MFSSIISVVREGAVPFFIESLAPMVFVDPLSLNVSASRILEKWWLGRKSSKESLTPGQFMVSKSAYLIVEPEVLCPHSYG